MSDIGNDTGFELTENDPSPSLAELEAAAERESEDGPLEAAEAAPEAKDLEPLPREEVERRWRQTQGALRSSRADLKAMRAELTELRGRSEVETPSSPPDPREDPIAAVEWMQSQFVAAQNQQAMSSFIGTVDSQEAEVAAGTPDYHEAVEFLRQTRRQELLDYGAPEEEVDGLVASEFSAGVVDARRQGLNPARVAYRLAQSRGFTRRGQLGAIEAGAAASRTLSANGGRGGADAGSLEARIANLSGAALRDAWRRHKAAMS